MSAPGPRLDAEGWLQGVRRIPSPNQDDRPAGTDIRLVVVHAISLPPGEFGGNDIVRLFTNSLDPAAHSFYHGLEGLRVSAHLLIRRGGETCQFVACSRRAWHAGASNWRGIERCNDFSIGIELEGCDQQPFAGIQYVRLARIVRSLRRRYPIEEVVGHSAIAPGRKTDPGPWFEWSRLEHLLRR